MLTTTADDQVFYAIRQDGAFLSGYEGLVFSDSQTFQTDQIRGAAVRKISASRTLIGANRRTEIYLNF